MHEHNETPPRERIVTVMLSGAEVAMLTVALWVTENDDRAEAARRAGMSLLDMEQLDADLYEDFKAVSASLGVNA